MSPRADITVEDGIAHIALQSGPSARLNSHVLDQIEAALTATEDDPSVEALVLSGKTGFPSGLVDPIAGGEDRTHRLGTLGRRLDAFPKPVIALLTGAVIGGGAELALACHYRLVQKDTRIGFPNVRLGLVPRAGATQRLPRLIGAGATLDLLLDGQLAPLGVGPMAGLADAVFETDPYRNILDFVQRLRAEGLTPRPTAGIRKGFLDAQAYQTAVKRARQKVEASAENAPRHIVSAVEAALVLPIEAGLAFEEAAAEDCSETPQARALAHIFHAEQKVAAATRRRDLPQVNTVAVLGGGPFAAQIVLSVLDAGLEVNWMIKDPAMSRDSVGQVHTSLQAAVNAGTISADKAQHCRNALRYGDGDDMLDGADIALRAARGQRGVKIPEALPVAHCMPGTDPRLAMHFGPAGPVRLVEIVLGPESTHEEERAALALAGRMTLLAVTQTTDKASYLDRMKEAMWRAADALVDLGQSPYTIDAALTHWDLTTPPFKAADRASLNAVARHERHPNGTNWSGVLLQHGRDGIGSGSGFYAYDAGGTATEDAEVSALLDRLRSSKPPLPAAQIVHLVQGAMANEGARILREAGLNRASDLDVVSVFGGLLPRWRGGVMHSAGAEGLLQLTKAMEAFDHPDRAFWTPDPIFADLIKNGRTFDAL